VVIGNGNDFEPRFLYSRKRSVIIHTLSQTSSVTCGRE
jgi:hypothetical protein